MPTHLNRKRWCHVRANWQYAEQSINQLAGAMIEETSWAKRLPK
jgi:hypothetical protein